MFHPHLSIYTAGFGTLLTQVAGLHRAVPSTTLDKVYSIVRVFYRVSAFLSRYKKEELSQTKAAVRGSGPGRRFSCVASAFYCAMASTRRRSTTATSARVAVPWGSSMPPSLPVIRPAPTA